MGLLYDEPVRLLMLGDTHANRFWFGRACDYADENDCDTIFQVGDFGYWPQRPVLDKFVERVAQEMFWRDKRTVFIDGNHEDHESLARDVARSDGRSPEGFVELRPRVFYVPRGHRWEWNGTSFLALGGAYSIDRHPKGKGWSWFEQEVIVAADVERAKEGGTVDVMVTHDCPRGMDAPSIRARNKEYFPASVDNRELLRQVVVAVRPRLLIHGHWHERYTDVLALPYNRDGHLAWHETRIEGLARDNRPGSWEILDLGAGGNEDGATAGTGDGMLRQLVDGDIEGSG